MADLSRSVTPARGKHRDLPALHIIHLVCSRKRNRNIVIRPVADGGKPIVTLEIGSAQASGKITWI
jgi:hypothetical protein